MMRVSAVCHKRHMALVALGVLFVGGMAVKMVCSILSTNCNHDDEVIPGNRYSLRVSC